MLTFVCFCFITMEIFPGNEEGKGENITSSQNLKSFICDTDVIFDEVVKIWFLLSCIKLRDIV